MVKRLGIILSFIAVLALVTGPVCFAAQKAVQKGKTTETAATNATCIDKMKNGLINVLTGWTEVPRKISESYGEDKNIFEALTIGTLKGIMYAFGRTAAGAVDTAFFFIPPYDKPLVEPLYNF